MEQLKLYVVMVAVVFTAFAKAQSPKQSRDYYKLVHDAFTNVQEAELDYYQNLLYKSEHKAKKTRATLVTKLKLNLLLIERANSHGADSLQASAINYLTDIYSYHHGEYDVIMDYNIPLDYDHSGFTNYLENSSIAREILRKSRVSFIMNLSDLHRQLRIKEPLFRGSDSAVKMDVALNGIRKAQEIYDAYNRLRIYENSFMQALKTDNLNAAMQLTDALKTDVTVATRYLDTFKSKNPYIQEVRTGVHYYNEVATYAQPALLNTFLEHKKLETLKDLKKNKELKKPDLLDAQILTIEDSLKKMNVEIARTTAVKQQQIRDKDLKLLKSQRDFLQAYIPAK